MPISPYSDDVHVEVFIKPPAEMLEVFLYRSSAFA
jgi:hypothetical protein